MASSLSNLVNNLSEGIHRIKSKYCKCFLEFTNFKDDLIEYKCSCCKKTYQHKFNKKLKEQFLIHTDYAHTKRVCKDFEIEHLGKYHDLYVQSNTVLLADVFENFRNMCINISELHIAKFLSAHGLAWQAALKKIKVKLDLLTDIDMLLMVEEGISRGICHSIY